MTRIKLVAASAGLFLGSAGAALAAIVTVQGSYTMQLNKTCLSETGPSTITLYGHASFILSTRVLTIKGFEDAITPANTSAKETSIDITEAYSFSSTGLTLGPSSYHAYYQAITGGVATIVAFGGIDSEGCIETGTLLR